MTTVYGVWAGYEDLDGIFSTKEKAIEYVRRMVASGNYLKDQFSICDYEVDAMAHDSQGERKS